MLKFTRMIIAMIMAVFSIGVAQAYDELVLDTNQTWVSSGYATFTPTADGTLTINATNGGTWATSASIMYGSGWTTVSFGYMSPGETAKVEIPVTAGNSIDLFFSGGSSDFTYIASTGSGEQGGGGETTTRPSTLTESYTFSIESGATIVADEVVNFINMKFPNLTGFGNPYAVQATIKATLSDGTTSTEAVGTGAPTLDDGATFVLNLAENKNYTLTVTDVVIKDMADNYKVLVDAYNAEGLATLTFSTSGPAADGTEAHPYILTAEGVAGPAAAMSASNFTYYKYVVEQAGVVSISNNITTSTFGGISINGGDYSSRIKGNFVAQAGDVFMVRIAAQGDCTSNLLKATWRALKDGETPETAKTLKEGTNDIAMVDNQSGAISNWYKLTIPANTTATVWFSSQNIVAQADGENIVLDEDKNWVMENSSASAKDVMIEVTGTNGLVTIVAMVSFEQGVAAKFSHLGDLAWSVQNNNLQEAASYITVTFPNRQGGEDSTPVKLENVYIFDANESGAPLNFDGTTEFIGNLGNGVNIYYNFELGKKYRVQVGNVTVNGTYNIPSADESYVGNGTIEFTVGEQQQVEAQEIEICSASMNGVSAGNTLYPMSRYVDLETFMPGLTKVADASKIYFVHQGTGWGADVSSANVSGVNGTTVTIDLGSNVGDVSTFEGNWTLTIQAGALSDNSGNITNKAAEFTWTCGQAAETPKAPTFASVTNNGKEPSTVKTMSNQFVVTFSTPVQAGYDYAKPILYYNDYTDYWQSTSVVYDGNTATYTFDGADLTKAGTYKLNLTYGIVANAERSDLIFEGYYNDLIWTISAEGEDPEPEPEDFDLTVTNGREESAIAEGSEVDKLFWFFYSTVKEGYQINDELQATLTKDGQTFGTSKAGGMNDTTIWWTFRNAEPDYMEQSGKYVLTIPEGIIIYADGTKNKAYTGTWTVKAPEVAKFDLTSVLNGNYEGAAPGEVSALNSQFTINLGEVAYASMGSGNITLTKDGEPYGGNATLTAYPDMKEIYARFNFNAEHEIFTPGTYVLTIPAGYIVNADGKSNAAWTGTWTVIEAAHAIDTEIIDPAEEQNLDELGEIFTLDGVWYESTNQNTPYMQIVNGNDLMTIEAQNIDVDTEGVATIVFKNKFVDGGTYTLFVPENTFVDADGNYNASCSATWTVSAKVTPVTDMEVANAPHGFMDAEEAVNGVIVSMPHTVAGWTVKGFISNDDDAEDGESFELTVDGDKIKITALELKPENSYTIMFTDVFNADGNHEWEGNAFLTFEVNKAVEIKVLGELAYNNIENGTAKDNSINASLINGEGYEATDIVTISATLNDGEAQTFSGTPAEIILFANELVDGDNLIDILSIEVSNFEGEPIVGWAKMDADTKTLNVKFDATATAILSIAAGQSDAKMFNINGQRTTTARGIVILNGKKVALKK